MLNLDSLTVDDNGRTSFSGLSSGIDFRGAVDAIIAAKRVPIDTLETRVTENADKITALQELRTSMNAVQSALSKLYGQVTFGNANDIFENKQAFATSSRLDGGTAAAAGNLLGISVTNATQLGSHAIEVLQTAAVHKVSSAAQTSTTTALGFAAGDSLTLNGKLISLSGGETLLDLRDAINGANAGGSPSGVTASIVTVSSTQHYLILSADSSGATMTLSDTTGTAMQTLGVLDGGGAFANELQAARSAQFYADGILDQTNTIYESAFQTASTVQAGSAGTLDFTRDSDSFPYGSVAYLATDDLDSLATKITAVHADITATVVNDGTGKRLEISGAAGFSISESGGGTVLTDLGITNKRQTITRTTNTIDDLFTGVTLTLFQAQAGTTISFDIERDLNAVKTEITNFVNAYNELKIIYNTHRQIDENTGTASEEAGALFSSRALADVDSALGLIIGAGVTGVSQQFSVLGQIGVDLISNAGLSDPLLKNTLVIDDAKLDDALLNNAEDVRKLFSFDFTSSDSRIRLLGFDGNTTYNAAGYTLNLHNVGAGTTTNLLTYSEQFDNAAWTKTRTAVSADTGVTTAPDGGNTADGIIADATLDTHLVTQTASVTAGQSYVFSTYAKQGAVDSVSLRAPGSMFLGGNEVNFNLNTGAISTPIGAQADDAWIENAGNGWYRVSMKLTATNTGAGTFEIFSANGAAKGFAGDGSSVSTYLWGAQVEGQTLDGSTFDETGVGTVAANIVNANGTTAPDGSLTADGLAGTNVATGHYVRANVAVTAGQKYKFVAYAKQGAQDQTYIRASSGFAAATEMTVNLTDGSIASVGAGVESSSVRSLGSGWYRIEIEATATSTATTDFEQYARSSSVGFGFLGDGTTTDIEFWNLRVIPETSGPGAYATATATTDPPTANIDGNADGSDDGSATITTGSAITVNTGGAQGLRLFYSGFNFDVSGINLGFTVGVGAQMFHKINALLDTQTGIVETEIDNLTDQNTLSDERIEDMLVRLDIKRQDLLSRFIRMETNLATTQRILDSIKQTTAAVLGNDN